MNQAGEILIHRNLKRGRQGFLEAVTPYRRDLVVAVKCLFDAGRIAPGAWADFAAIDLGSPLLDGLTPETLLEDLILRAMEAVVAATRVGGRREETTLCVDATR